MLINHGLGGTQIKMVLFDSPNLTGGIDDAIIGTVTAVPIFMPMFLLFVFFVVLIGGANAQNKRIGRMDIPMWTTIASLSTLVISLPLTVIEGMIQLTTLSVVVVVTIMSGFWLFFDRNRNEV
jgi:heme/copper-type cytochrome/quinol oxidase subunit 2